MKSALFITIFTLIRLVIPGLLLLIIGDKIQRGEKARAE